MRTSDGVVDPFDVRFGAERFVNGLHALHSGSGGLFGGHRFADHQHIGLEARQSRRRFGAELHKTVDLLRCQLQERQLHAIHFARQNALHCHQLLQYTTLRLLQTVHQILTRLFAHAQRSGSADG